MYEVSVVIPVYNSEGCIRPLVEALIAELDSICHNFEVLLVNDGSKDNSKLVINKLEQDYPCVKAVNLSRNYGQHNALLCGIRQAAFPLIVTMDDDFQNPVEEVIKLLDELAKGYDVVYGCPLREQHGLFRDLASKTTKAVLQNAMGAECASNVSAFRAFRTYLREAFRDYNGQFVSIDVLLTWGTTNFSAIRVNHAPRKMGASNYGLNKLIAHALNMITGFSTLPLQIASLNGFACVGLGILLLIYVMARYLMQGVAVPGFAFLASIVIIFSGAQLLALGIIGEYIARIYSRAMQRPAYVVKERQEIAGRTTSISEETAVR